MNAMSTLARCSLSSFARAPDSVSADSQNRHKTCRFQLKPSSDKLKSVTARVAQQAAR